LQGVEADREGSALSGAVGHGCLLAKGHWRVAIVA